ncbi:MAG TPA: hypothetical protein HPP87_13400, partial [Planctomycetes bacterium]|nr:hypothetical protein [Planctomycetota bacterium]
PLSYRPWPGTFKPGQIGLTTWQFTLHFARQMPGGGPGQMKSQNPDEIMRQFVSGELEINCLACHNTHPGQDQAEYAAQIEKQNFRWAATASCEFAAVKGAAAKQGDTYDPLMSDAISVEYQKSAFGYRDKVLFHISKDIPPKRCYFCHSNFDINPGHKQEWMQNQDVHLNSGLRCVDCHRNGIEHKTIRGYEGEPVTNQALSNAYTCRGCHLGDGAASEIIGGLGAPRPEHPGIPEIHFEKLSCTACHSGVMPAKTTYRTKTARAHGLGTHDADKSPEALPHIVYPVFAQASDGKITPYKLVWPSFWATLDGQNVEPIEIRQVRRIAGKILQSADSEETGGWTEITEKQIAKVLKAFDEENSIEGKAVYITGGSLYQIVDSKLTETENHPVAKPNMWPIAHDVRPAEQALGNSYCEECHSTDSPFVFGNIVVDSPVAKQRNKTKIMVEFQDQSPLYMRLFAMSFVFRPWLKIVALLSCAAIAAVLAYYGLKAIGCIIDFVTEKVNPNK